MSRLPSGGRIDRGTVLSFTFDGEEMHGHPGDTLASALLAQDRHFVARSIKYHRPRGILSAGIEEPSALVTVADATGSTPNLKATEVALRDGLRVFSQNAWPRLERDAGALIGLGGRALGAGFYYKTFLWPAGAWSGTWSRPIRPRTRRCTTSAVKAATYWLSAPVPRDFRRPSPRRSPARR
jgi:sarcosine oxidase subunit alpha